LSGKYDEIEGMRREDVGIVRPDIGVQKITVGGRRVWKPPYEVMKKMPTGGEVGVSEKPAMPVTVELKAPVVAEFDLKRFGPVLEELYPVLGELFEGYLRHLEQVRRSLNIVLARPPHLLSYTNSFPPSPLPPSGPQLFHHGVQERCKLQRHDEPLAVVPEGSVDEAEDCVPRRADEQWQDVSGVAEVGGGGEWFVLGAVEVAGAGGLRGVDGGGRVLQLDDGAGEAGGAVCDA